MCKATILLRGISVLGEPEPRFAIDHPIADILKRLLFRVYGERDDIVISNIRLFALLAILDIGVGERSGETATSGKWKWGLATPYPVDYYSYLKENGWFSDGKGDLAQVNLEDIWQSKSRVVFSISFADNNEPRVFSPAVEETLDCICDLLKGIGDPLGAVFNEPYDLTASVDQWENGHFREIDREIILCAYSLEPLRRSYVETDGDLDLSAYAKHLFSTKNDESQDDVAPEIRETAAVEFVAEPGN